MENNPIESLSVEKVLQCCPSRILGNAEISPEYPDPPLPPMGSFTTPPVLNINAFLISSKHLRTLHSSSDPIIVDFKSPMTCGGEKLPNKFVGKERTLEAYRIMRIQLGHEIDCRNDSGFLLAWSSPGEDSMSSIHRFPMDGYTNQAASYQDKISQCVIADANIFEEEEREEEKTSKKLSKAKKVVIQQVIKPSRQSIQKQVRPIIKKKHQSENSLETNLNLAKNVFVSKASTIRQNTALRREDFKDKLVEKIRTLQAQHEHTFADTNMTEDVTTSIKSIHTDELEGKPGFTLKSEIHSTCSDQKKGRTRTNAIEKSAEYQDILLPLRVDLQERMEIVLEKLKMNASSKLHLVLKYTNPVHANHLEGALKLWEQASSIIIEREAVLKKITQFEMDASDPRRHFNTISTKRLEEAKARRVLDLKFEKVSVKCHKIVNYLFTVHDDVVMYGDQDYRKKMKTDYVDSLHKVEETRYRIFMEQRFRS